MGRKISFTFLGEGAASSVNDHPQTWHREMCPQPGHEKMEETLNSVVPSWKDKPLVS